MKKSSIFFFAYLCLLAAKPVQADFSPQKVRELYANLPFRARGVYNQKVNVNFAELSAINGFFSTVFSRKVEKLNSPKINFTPKMTGWTAIVFRTIYESASSAKDLPAALAAPYAKILDGIVSAAGSASSEIGFNSNHSTIAPMILAFLFSISVLPIHKIKYRLFIQRE